MELNYHLDLWEWVFLIGLFVSAAGLVRFYVKVYAKLPKYVQPRIQDEEKTPVSVVLSGKNQYEALKKNLTFWLEQQYPDFEVIVVYENTDEDTAALLRDFARRYERLKLINANQSINFFDEKKFSLSIGVKSAVNEYVILTNPMFRPASEHCIEYIRAAFRPSTNIVIGHPVYGEQSRSVCPLWACRVAEITFQYLGFALRGQAFTGRRDLIAYRKNFFLEHQGYADTYALNTGRFDRIGSHIKSADEVNLQLAPESEVRFTGLFSLKSILKAERQYLNMLYSEKSAAHSEIRIYRNLVPLFFVFFIGGIVYFCTHHLQAGYEEVSFWAICFGTVAAVKFLLQAIIMQRAGNVLRTGLFWFFLPLYEILYLPLQFALALGKKRGR